MNKKIIVLALIFSALLVIRASPTYASGPTITASVSSASCYNANTGSSFTCSLTVTAGDVVVVFAGCDINPTCGTLTVSDSLSNTWTVITTANNAACTNANCVEKAWYAVAASSGSDTFTIGDSGTVAYLGADIYDVSGIVANGLAYSTGTGSGNPSPQPSVTSYTPSGPVVLAGLAANADYGTWTAGTGYTLISGQPQGTTNGRWSVSEYLLSASGTTTSPFSFSGGTLYGFAEISVSFKTPIFATVSDSFNFHDVSVLGTITNTFQLVKDYFDLTCTPANTNYLTGVCIPPFFSDTIKNVLTPLIITITEQACSPFSGSGTVNACTKVFNFLDTISSVVTSAATTITSITSTIVGTITLTTTIFAQCSTNCFVTTDNGIDWFYTAVLMPLILIMAPALILVGLGIKNEGVLFGVTALVVLTLAGANVLPPWFVFLSIIFAAGALFAIFRSWWEGGTTT